jgi:hypothetical protein
VCIFVKADIMDDYVDVVGYSPLETEAAEVEAAEVEAAEVAEVEVAEEVAEVEVAEEVAEVEVAEATEVAEEVAEATEAAEVEAAEAAEAAAETSRASKAEKVARKAAKEAAKEAARVAARVAWLQKAESMASQVRDTLSKIAAGDVFSKYNGKKLVPTKQMEKVKGCRSKASRAVLWFKKGKLPEDEIAEWEAWELDVLRQVDSLMEMLVQLQQRRRLEMAKRDSSGGSSGDSSTASGGSSTDTASTCEVPVHAGEKKATLKRVLGDAQAPKGKKGASAGPLDMLDLAIDAHRQASAAQLSAEKLQKQRMDLEAKEALYTKKQGEKQHERGLWASRAVLHLLCAEGKKHLRRACLHFAGDGLFATELTEDARRFFFSLVESAEVAEIAEDGLSKEMVKQLLESVAAVVDHDEELVMSLFLRVFKCPCGGGGGSSSSSVCSAPPTVDIDIAKGHCSAMSHDGDGLPLAAQFTVTPKQLHVLKQFLGLADDDVTRATAFVGSLVFVCSPL